MILRANVLSLSLHIFTLFVSLRNSFTFILGWTLECGIKESRLPKRFLIMDILMFGIRSTDQDLVAFQVHPADLPRRFQQPLKLDNYYQA